MLSIREKLSLQKDVSEDQKKLASGISDLRTRLSVQKGMNESLARLNGEKREQTVLDRFLAGEFTKELPIVFREKLIECANLLQGKIEPLIKPFRMFMEYHENQMAPVLESASANSAQFEHLLEMIKSGELKGSITLKID